MAVCFVTGGNYHYSGLCDFSAITHYTTIVAYASLRVKLSTEWMCQNFFIKLGLLFSSSFSHYIY